jgi:phage terminase large subunit
MINSSGARNGIIYADSAEPKTAELKQYGLKVLPVIKGRNYGIQLIQEQPFKVTSRSSNLIKELQNYVWSKDKEGNLLSIPIDTWNHGLDALRYLFLMKFSKEQHTLTWKH